MEDHIIKNKQINRDSRKVENYRKRSCTLEKIK
jgi:hypothetical protein